MRLASSACAKRARAEVRRADRLHLALVLQLRVRLERLLERRRVVVPMRLVKIDGVDVQAPQRSFGRAQDVVRLQDLVAVAHVGADLGGDDHVVVAAAAADPAADDRLRLAALVARRPARVRVRRVDQIAARRHERVEQGKRGRLVRGPSEHVPAEGQRRDGKARASQRTLLHVDLQARRTIARRDCAIAPSGGAVGILR